MSAWDFDFNSRDPWGDGWASGSSLPNGGWGVPSWGSSDWRDLFGMMGPNGIVERPGDNNDPNWRRWLDIFQAPIYGNGGTSRGGFFPDGYGDIWDRSNWNRDTLTGLGLSALVHGLANREGANKIRQQGFSSQMPQIAPDALPLRESLLNLHRNNLLRTPANQAQMLVRSIDNAERARIGRQAGMLGSSLQRQTSQQGLGNSAAAALQRGAVDNFRANAGATLAGQMADRRLGALAYDQNALQNRLGNAGSFLASLPYGQRNEFDYTQTGMHQGWLGGAAGGALEALNTWINNRPRPVGTASPDIPTAPNIPGAPDPKDPAGNSFFNRPRWQF